jgi:hypothetical protein
MQSEVINNLIMPIFATFDLLRKFGSDDKAKHLLKEASVESERKYKTVFLSHSSKDDDLVGGVVLVLENHGGKVYVDHSDPFIPGKDCLAIAEHLRIVIRGCSKFILLASPRSKDSTWIPWELGLGDGIHRPDNVALFPSVETIGDTAWSEREYLGLYKRIVFGGLQGHDEKVWMVWDFRANTAQELNAWLAS